MSPANLLAPYVVMVGAQLGIPPPELSCQWGEDGCGWVYWSARAAFTKYQGVGGLNSRHLFYHTSGGCKSKIKVLAGLVSSEASRLGFVDGHLLPLSSRGLSSVPVS